MKDAVFRRVTDEEIEDEVPFLLSWGFDPEPLETSLESVGQVSPLVLRPHQDRLQLICGFRRRLALRKLGRREYQALILAGDTGDQQTLVLALEDNLGHRSLNDAEKTLALSHLARFFPAGELIERFLPRLGLPPKNEFLERFLRLEELGPEGLDALAREDLDPETAELLLTLDGRNRAAVLSLLMKLRPGLNKRRQIVTWLIEIGRRENLALEAVINEDLVQTVLKNQDPNRPQKEKMVRAALRERRYPHLTRLQEKQADQMRALKLPPRVRLIPPPNFEGLDFTLQITFADLKELGQGSKTLERIRKSPSLAALLEIG